MQIDQQVKYDIVNAVNAGKEVTVSKTNITYNEWSGCGYIIINPETGAGAYMLSGGLNGGFMYIFWTVMWALAWIALITAITVFVPLVAAVVVEYSFPVVIAVLAAKVFKLSLTAEFALFSNEEIYLLWTALKEFNGMSPSSDSIIPKDYEWLIYGLVRLILAVGA